MAPTKRAWPLMCFVVLGFRQLCFVQGWPVPIKDNILTSKIQRCVRERRRPVTGMRKVPLDKDVRMITSKIKNTQTAGELLDYADTVVDKPIFNYIHVAATYTKLGNFQKKGGLSPAEVRSNVLLRLGDRLQGMLLRKEVGAQGLANMIWAFASLFLDVPVVLKLVPALAEQIPGKAGDMIPQALSNSLWAAAQLQDAAPEVLQVLPVIVAEIEIKAGGMKPQELSNSLWAAAKLQDAAPEVLKIVPALLEQIPLKARDMTPQDLSNSLWALKDFPDASPAVPRAVQALVEEIPSKINGMDAQGLANTLEALVFLRESFPTVEQSGVVAAAATQLNRILPKLKHKELMLDVPTVIWACRRCNVKDQQLFIAVANRFSSHDMVASLPPWDLCALSLGMTR